MIRQKAKAVTYCCILSSTSADFCQTVSAQHRPKLDKFSTKLPAEEFSFQHYVDYNKASSNRVISLKFSTVLLPVDRVG